MSCESKMVWLYVLGDRHEAQLQAYARVGGDTVTGERAGTAACTITFISDEAVTNSHDKYRGATTGRGGSIPRRNHTHETHGANKKARG